MESDRSIPIGLSPSNESLTPSAPLHPSAATDLHFRSKCHQSVWLLSLSLASSTPTATNLLTALLTLLASHTNASHQPPSTTGIQPQQPNSQPTTNNQQATRPITLAPSRRRHTQQQTYLFASRFANRFALLVRPTTTTRTTTTPNPCRCRPTRLRPPAAHSPDRIQRSIRGYPESRHRAAFLVKTNRFIRA
jgi:hypothetical protein